MAKVDLSIPFADSFKTEYKKYIRLTKSIFKGTYSKFIKSFIIGYTPKIIEFLDENPKYNTLSIDKKYLSVTHSFMQKQSNLSDFRRGLDCLENEKDSEIAKTRWYVVTLWVIGFFYCGYNNPLLKKGTTHNVSYVDKGHSMISRMQILADAMVNPNLKPMSKNEIYTFETNLIRIVPSRVSSENFPSDTELDNYNI